MTDKFKRKILQSNFSRKLFNFIQSKFYRGSGYKNEKLLQEYNENGIVIIPSLFSHNECNKILSIVDETIDMCNRDILQDNAIKTIDNKQVYSNGERKIYSFDFSETQSFVNSMIHDKKIKQICEYLNQLKLIFMQHWTKRVLPRESDAFMMNENWHQDSGGLSMIRFIVYLEDVSEGQGPLEYIMGSHNMEIINPSAYVKTHPEKLCKVVGKKGDVIIANVTGGWHRATKVTSAKRDTLQVAYSSIVGDKVNRIFRFGSYLQ